MSEITFSSEAAEEAAGGLNPDQLAEIEATGKDGKITKADVEAYLEAGEQTAPQSEQAPEFEPGEERDVEAVYGHNQSWLDPFSGVQTILGYPAPSGAVLLADGEPASRISPAEDVVYTAVIPEQAE